MSRRILQFNAQSPYRQLIGVGGIGTGLFFELEGNHTLGRNESRPARLLNVRDYCKLYIISHYVAILLGASPSGSPFHVLSIGKVGADDAGRRMIGEMASAGIDTRYVEVLPDQGTLMSVCSQYPDGSGGNITTNNSATSALTSSDIDTCEALFADKGSRTIVLAAPEVPLEVRQHLLELATMHHAFRAAALTSAEIEPARKARFFSHVDIVAMNEDEAGTLIGEAFDAANPRPFIDRCADTLRADQEHIEIILTVGERGAFAFAEGSWDYCPAANVPVVNTAGAGDALLAGVLSALAVGIPFIRSGPTRVSVRDRPLDSAFDFGMLLAAYTVTSPHTIHPCAGVDTLLSFAQELGVTISAAMNGYL
jgi:sugar/nucleoside kinase (ribokinase family)